MRCAPPNRITRVNCGHRPYLRHEMAMASKPLPARHSVVSISVNSRHDGAHLIEVRIDIGTLVMPVLRRLRQLQCKVS